MINSYSEVIFSNKKLSGINIQNKQGIIDENQSNFLKNGMPDFV